MFNARQVYVLYSEGSSSIIFFSRVFGQCTDDFFARVSPNKNIEIKNIFHGNPVEVRSFDGKQLGDTD